MSKKIIAVLSVLVLAGCSTNSKRDQLIEFAEEQKAERAEQLEKVVNEAPDWYFSPPVSSSGIVGVGYSKSPDLQFAMEQAKLVASSQIAETYNPKVSVLKKSFKKQTQSNNPVVSGQASSTVDLFVDETDLSGAQVTDTEYFVDHGMAHVYIQMFLPFDDVNQIKAQRKQAEIEKASVYDADKAHQELRDRVKDSES